MSASREDLGNPINESKLEAVATTPTDNEIIDFIFAHVTDAEFLAEYFSELKRPLTTPILTLKISHTGGTNNFLGHAAIFGVKYFKHIVRLATSEAIDAALVEDPADDNSMASLTATLLFQDATKREGVLELIEKASQQAIDVAILKPSQGANPPALCVALNFSFVGADDITAYTLINKASREALNMAAMLICNGYNLFHIVIECKRSYFIVNTFLSRLHPKTKNDLISMQNEHNGIQIRSPFAFLFKPKSYHNSEAEDVITCEFIKNISNDENNDFINKLAKGLFIPTHKNLLVALILSKQSQFVIDEIMPRLHENVINELVLDRNFFGVNPLFLCTLRGIKTGQISTDISVSNNMTAVFLIPYIKEEILSEFVKDPGNFKEIADSLSNAGRRITALNSATSKNLSGTNLTIMCKYNPPMFNAIMHKLTSIGERIYLDGLSMYRADAFTLSRYFAQHPELSPIEIKKLKGFPFLKNRKYRPGFETRLREGAILFEKERVLLLTTYICLQKCRAPEDVFYLMMVYLGVDKSIENRICYEIENMTNPNAIHMLEEIYGHVRKYFSDNYKHSNRDISSIVLSFLASNQCSSDVAVRNWIKADDAKKKNHLFSSRLGVFFHKKADDHKHDDHTYRLKR